MVKDYSSLCKKDFFDNNSFSVSTTSSSGIQQSTGQTAVCPVDCCIPDEDVVETEKELLSKKSFLHRDE